MRILHISTRLILGGSQENTVLSCEGQARRGHEVHLAFGPIYGPEGSLLERVEKFRVEGTKERSEEATERRSDEGGEPASEPLRSSPAPSGGGVTRGLASVTEGASGVAGAHDGRIHTHVIPNLVREINPIKDRRALRELRELIERIRPDIVHTHSSKAGILGRWAAWQANERLLQSRPRKGAGETHDSSTRPSHTNSSTSAGSPFLGVDSSRSIDAPPAPFRGRLRCAIIHTIHGPPFMPIEGGPLRRLKTRALNHAYTHAERSAAKHCHTIVSVADAMTREFLRRGIGTPDQYVTVRSGMEIEPFLTPTLRPDGTPETRENVRDMLGLKPDDFVIGTVARLAQHKGHDDLLDALAQDLRAHPNWKLLWVGDGWWRARLVQRSIAEVGSVHELDVNTIHREATANLKGQLIVGGDSHDAQVLLTGLVPPEHIPGLIRAMDLLAHPSYREGLPRTVPQALLCGVPVVAYDCDGTGEVCRDMDTGRLVKTGDIQGLGNAIRWMADHPAERRAMGERGRAMCIHDFSAEKMVDNLERVYARALQLARG